MRTDRRPDMGRMVAICYDGNEDLNLEMLRQGWAVVYGKFINNVPEKTRAYQDAQKQAKNRPIGLWSGEFVSPKGWRKGERLSGCECPRHMCPGGSIGRKLAVINV